MLDTWILAYANCVAELGRMLSMHFIWTEEGYKSTGAKTPIGDSVLMVGIYHNEGDYAARDVQLGRLMMLVNHLSIIEKYDKALLNKFKRAFSATSKNWETHFGVRMELNVAAKLVKNGVAFKKTESPDYIIGVNGVFLECTSSHKINDSSNMFDKIRAVIVSKSKKKYCNRSTALCIDITNVSATNNEIERQLLSSKDDLKRLVAGILKDTNPSFGSILLFSYFFDVERNFHSGYWRIDDDGAMPELIEFLNKCYPVGEVNTGAGWAPQAG